ncbi:hypothetical protein PsorP6_010175 [Peronosclerospora sorghi]|uniref:Uncharacterized protein n=1 Tax=Peronosclerospora sorghi TaxID=230839 RepID=A0ACC0VUK2_9STRA|nr:hypothetical protein PsorP6_010175 [Peronosclerospora sorghi]
MRKDICLNAFDYYAAGADVMVTLKENREAFERSVCIHGTTLLGHRISSPICVAPSAMHRMAHLDGEISSTSAAARADTCYILSTISTTIKPILMLYAGTNYTFKDRELTRGLALRADKAGYKSIVLTVDMPILGHREPDFCNRFSLPNHLTMANFTQVGGAHERGVNSLRDSGLAEYVSELFDLTINWNNVKWLKSITNLPVIVKGVLCLEDAKIAVDWDYGVAATIDTLPANVKAVDGRAKVYFLDGGVFRGTDVFNALALGARAVFLGRPILFGLAHSVSGVYYRLILLMGEDGVANVFRILNNELKHAILFSGTATLADIRYGGSTSPPFVCPSWLATTTIVTMNGGSISMEFPNKDIQDQLF